MGLGPLLQRLAVLTRGDFDVVGDVTVEAWVNPEPGVAAPRLVQHRSPSCSYVLGLRAVPSALAFNGVDQLAKVRGLAGLDLHGPLTVAAWVMPTAISSQLRYVVARGLDAGHTAEIALRIVGEQYQFGCFDGKDHFAVSGPEVKVSDDHNRWVHLAGVYDGTSWRVYRNGAQVGELIDAAQAAVPTSAGWAIGGSFDGSRLFAGSIGDFDFDRRLV